MALKVLERVKKSNFPKFKETLLTVYFREYFILKVQNLNLLVHGSFSTFAARLTTGEICVTEMWNSLPKAITTFTF